MANCTCNFGYIVFTNGLTLQWGTLYGCSLSCIQKFPIAFSNYVASIAFMTNNSSGTSEGIEFIYNYDKTGVTPAVKWMSDYTVGAIQRSVKYFAIGY